MVVWRHDGVTLIFIVLSWLNWIWRLLQHVLIWPGSVVVVVRNLGFAGTATRWSREVSGIERLNAQTWRYLLMPVGIFEICTSAIAFTSIYSINWPIFVFFFAIKLCSR